MTDALRSVKRQVDVVLNGAPEVLGEVWWGPDPFDHSTATYRWTHQGMVAGCLEVPEGAWTWLTLSPLCAPEVVEVAPRRWERRRLLFEPSAGELAAEALPTSGTPVAASLLEIRPGHENPWQVRLAAERGELTYPFCRVALVGGPVVQSSATYYSVTQPMVIECYPVERAQDADHAVLVATDVGDLLTRGVIGEGFGLGRSSRIPLFDYEGVSLEKGVSQRRLAQDFLAVQDWSTRTLPDPNDQRRVALVADLRANWRVPVSRHRGAQLVDSVNIVTAGT